MLTVYVLVLERGKLYVGCTDRLQHRIDNHFSGVGSTWTKTYKPLRVLGACIGGADIEKHITLSLMRAYGWENVRGGSWTNTKLGGPPKELKYCNALTGLEGEGRCDQLGNKAMHPRELLETVPLDSVWEHTNGSLYRVIGIANELTKNHHKYPVTVVYVNSETGTLWSRPILDWHRSMKQVKP